MRREGTERQRKTGRTQGSDRVIRAEEGAREKAPEGTWAEARGVGQGCPFSWTREKEPHRADPCTLPRSGILAFRGPTRASSSKGVSESCGT